MPLFIYDRAQRDQLIEEINKMKRLPSMRTEGVFPEDLRAALRVLLNHNLVIVPSAIEHCTPLVERFRAIALIAGIEVKNAAAYCAGRFPNQGTKPAAAVPVPPTPVHAVAG